MKRLGQCMTWPMLQWGHDFSAVEILVSDSQDAARLEALQWGHDFSAVEIGCFDGE